MTPIKQGKYEFKKDSLTNIRKKMGLSQGKMAELLGVPANTLSRWEIGTTAPDARSLAAVYSVAKEHGITPEFFGISGNAKPFHYNLIVIWDFQTVGTPVSWVQYAHNTIMTELSKRFAGMTPIFKAFTHPSQQEAAKELEKLDWRVWEGNDEIYDDIINQAKGDSGHNPEGTVLVLISKDNGLAELLEELKENGVQVYVMSPQTYGNKLSEKVGQGFSIPWYPVSLEQPKRPINLPTLPTLDQWFKTV